MVPYNQGNQLKKKIFDERCDVKKYLPTHKSNTAYCHITGDFSIFCAHFSRESSLPKDRIENGETIKRKRFVKGGNKPAKPAKMVRWLF